MPTDRQIRWDNIVEVRAGAFTDDGFLVQMLGDPSFFKLGTTRVRYTLQAAALDPDSALPVLAQADFTAEEVGFGRLLYFAAILAVVLIYLLAMVYYAFMGTPTRQRATRMLVLTYVAALFFVAMPFLGPMFVFISSDFETILRTTPVGFLKAGIGRPEEVQWVLNIGGVMTPTGSLRGGIAIPLLIVVLAMLGGAINMLRRLPDFLTMYDKIPEADTTGDPQPGRELRSSLFRYFVYILSSPFIAMIAYSLMFILDYTNTHALAIVAFSVGFISDTVVESILGRVRTMLGAKEGSHDTTTNNGAASGSADRAAIVPPTPTGTSDAERREIGGRRDGHAKGSQDPRSMYRLLVIGRFEPMMLTSHFSLEELSPQRSSL